MALDEKYRALLGKIAFLACRRTMYSEAETIFNALQATAPEKAGPVIGRASVLLGQGKTDEAIKLLKDNALKNSPDDLDALAYLGLAYFMDGQPEKAAETLASLKDDAQNQSPLAAEILAEIEKARA